jgi:gamma-glutamyltranspeptidase/glutathione hydrolase
MVAAKTPEAALAGAEVLRRGGNAVDAIVATAFVAGVAEPWMNGVGGGGFMVHHDPATGKASVVEFPMVSAARATADMFPLTGGTDSALFGWPSTVGNANIVGARAVSVPGTVAGLALARERFGSLPLSELVQPAIELAERGVPVTWHTTLEVARDLTNLQKFPATTAIFCNEAGNPPFTLDPGSPVYFRQTDLANTLRAIAAQGQDAFYKGEIAKRMVDHLTELGGILSYDDFANYTARIVEAVENKFDGHSIFTTSGPSGGTTLSQALRLLDGLGLGSLGFNTPEAIHLFAQAFRIAFADRFAYVADPNFVETPIDAMLSSDYIARRKTEIHSGKLGRLTAGDRSALGVTHNLAGSMPDYARGGCTTHMSAIDKDGVAVSLTQTLLSIWGSRVTAPGTGVLFNNGMMWFDPEPGKPNSIAGGKVGMSNMAPAILARSGRAIAAIGSSGGRRIIGCNAQIGINLIHHGQTIQQAVSAPRVDVSTPDLLLDSRIPESTIAALHALGHRTSSRDEREMRGEFASPACVQFADGLFRAGVDPYYFPATGAGVD